MASLPSTSAAQHQGLTRCIVNNFRFHVAVTVKGRQVLLQVCEWLYQAKGTYIKVFLSTKISMKRFKSMFNRDQMRLLDPEADWKFFDVSLLHILLQNVCGLAPGEDPVWTDSSRLTLEYRIFQVKSYRNATAHSTDFLPLSDTDLGIKLTELQNILSDILRLAGNRAGMNSGLVGSQINDVAQYFQDLQMKLREPLDVSDTSSIPHLQQELAVFMDTLKSSIQSDCEDELVASYPDEFELELVSWLFPDMKVRPSLMFTKLVIEEDVSLSRPSQGLQPRDVKYEDILCVKSRAGHTPDVLLVAGEGGVGKSTLLKYLCENWVEEVAARKASQGQPATEIKGLQDLSPMLFFQLRETTVSTWEEMLDRRLSKSLANSGLTVQDFGRAVKQMKTIVLLDGFDEAQPDSEKLVRELFDIPDIRIVVTTRPESLPKLTRLVPGRKKMMAIRILGIRKEDRFLFVEKTVAALVKDDEDRRREANEKLRGKLEQSAFIKGFKTPLNLELLVILELESPDILAESSSFSEIYQELIHLIRGKVEDRRTLQGITDLEGKMSLYIELHEQIALQSLIKSEHDLSSSTVTQLETKCRELGLPSSEVLSGYFTLKRTWKGLKLINIWSYPHGRFQEQWAANYIVNQLLRIPLDDIPDISNQLSKEREKPLWSRHCGMDFIEESIHRPGDESLEAVDLDELAAKHPILNLISGGKALTKELMHSDKVQNVLAMTTGLLARSHQHILKKVAPAILTLTSLGRNMPSILLVDRILRNIQEAKEMEEFVQPALNVFRRSNFWMFEGDCLAALRGVLDYEFPEDLSLTLSTCHSTSAKESVLEALSERNLRIALQLKMELTDPAKCVEILTRPGSKCMLCLLECHLLEQTVPLLPDYLTTLEVKIDIQCYKALTTKIPSLFRLCTLTLHMDVEERPDPMTLPLLIYKGQKLRLWSPVSMSSSDIVWWCGVLSRMCPPPAEEAMSGDVVGSRGNVGLLFYILTAEDVSLLLKELHARSISCKNIMIYPESGYEKSIVEAATTEAKTLGICTDLYIAQR